MKINEPRSEEDASPDLFQDTVSFHGQIGPVYLFCDAISSDQVHGIYSLGPSYMYSFDDNEFDPVYDSPFPSVILDAKDGLASKIIFGLNAQVFPSFTKLTFCFLIFSKIKNCWVPFSGK